MMPPSRAVALAALAARAAGHEHVVFPPPRNAIDSNIAPWTGKAPGQGSIYNGWCPISAYAATTNCAIGADSVNLPLGCNGGGVITKVTLASYGIVAGDCAAGLRPDAACHVDVSAGVAQQCIGRQVCNVNCSAGACAGVPVPDPCPGTPNQTLAVAVECGARTGAAGTVEATCGKEGINNAGAEMPDMPIVSGSACDCANICQKTSGCAGWTWSAAQYVKGSRNCYLRSSWGAPADNCKDCRSESNGASPWALSGSAGQACLWFSNGCAIGCDACDGTSRGPIPNRGNKWRRKFPVCANNTFKATICDPALRTVNTAAQCGAADDWYYYSPWRAPGYAPVFDACGMAGGKPGTAGGFGADFMPTRFAKQGDLGSKVLPERPTGTVWRAGAVVSVSWGIQANHGGGYQWRLCPKAMPLTEQCFQNMPLAFVGQQCFRWGGVGGKEFCFNGTYVSSGTKPAGSMWSMNPIPRNDVGQTGQGFAPRCNATAQFPCSGMAGGSPSSHGGDLEIVDQLQIPAGLAAGEYVLGWRHDQEESNQIWASCSDVSISA